MNEIKPDYKNFFLYVGLLLACAVTVFLIFSRNNSQPEKLTQQDEQSATDSSIMKKPYSASPPMTIDAKKKYAATLETSKGTVAVELFASEAPNTVNNFVFLARDGFYDQTTFHRVVKDFMIQGGDPKGDGTGGPGYKFADEKVTRDYKRGIVAMANSGPDTNGSQFFIMHADYPLPKNYVIFGRVVSGIEVVDKIAEVKVQPNAYTEEPAPAAPVLVISVIVK